MPGGRIAEPRPRSEAARMNVKQLTDTLRRLVAKRQALRDHGAGRAELEHNRLEIVRRQQDLSQALIESHLPEQLAQAA
jgi:hypothetical protein